MRQEKSESSEPALKLSRFQESESSSSKDGNLPPSQEKQEIQLQAKQSVQPTTLRSMASSEKDKDEKKVRTLESAGKRETKRAHNRNEQDPPKIMMKIAE